ncbi:expressed unknown protein [Seminavis robusta]|uniref:Uncharacterized protein n=1 Tax=Seminavis robusta TaxID=568900 RepID=A0A9N8F1A4_9STRA|nr:expressed unknown protein [Seminavis robusta]|eukprot:Sro2550_g330940.1 n/a (220) ;mRNA; f:4338-4997
MTQYGPYQVEDIAFCDNHRVDDECAKYIVQFLNDEKASRKLSGVDLLNTGITKAGAQMILDAVKAKQQRLYQPMTLWLGTDPLAESTISPREMYELACSIMECNDECIRMAEQSPEFCRKKQEVKMAGCGYAEEEIRSLVVSELVSIIFLVGVTADFTDLLSQDLYRHLRTVSSLQRITFSLMKNRVTMRLQRTGDVDLLFGLNLRFDSIQSFRGLIIP